MRDARMGREKLTVIVENGEYAKTYLEKKDLGIVLPGTEIDLKEGRCFKD